MCKVVKESEAKVNSFQTFYIFQEIKGFYIGKLNSFNWIVVVYARSGENEQVNRYMISIKGFIEGE
ncbi:hypothetical protein CN386_17015 [Bacillus cereus]|nr:hypothetical protein MLA2C4_10490 [Bacillus mobilis]PEU76321.1 hypothetical protein CN386_17015 [Bacillus cereus]PGT76921.1 hypothetical protein COD14_08065 [Bacillus cereus]PGV95614.1 hypothetical protein COD86_12130 [Bacillus cereus]BCD28955.1 hypothetical protein BC30102_1991 [Bacillus cereus]